MNILVSFFCFALLGAVIALCLYGCCRCIKCGNRIQVICTLIVSLFFTSGFIICVAETPGKLLGRPVTIYAPGMVTAGIFLAAGTAFMVTLIALIRKTEGYRRHRIIYLPLAILNAVYLVASVFLCVNASLI